MSKRLMDPQKNVVRKEIPGWKGGTVQKQTSVQTHTLSQPERDDTLIGSGLGPMTQEEARRMREEEEKRGVGRVMDRGAQAEAYFRSSHNKDTSLSMDLFVP